MSNLYQEIALELARKIENGVYDVGEKMPGIRVLKTQFQVSTSTAVAAYRQLEEGGYIASRPRSGFYVCQREKPWFAAPSVLGSLPKRPKLVAEQARLVSLLEQVNNPSVIKLGAAIPDPFYLPIQQVKKMSSDILRSDARAFSYEDPLGAVELRHQIFKRMGQLGCACTAEDILISNGCHEAVFIALRALTSPGDVVAVESPTYQGHVQIIAALGLKAVEIPGDPDEGISLSALELVFEQWEVRACLLIPNFSNPLGAIISDKNKKRLITLASEFNVNVIEDDIYGDLDFSGVRPLPLKAFDNKGVVTYCSSVSKTISPGVRIGWLLNAQLIESLQYQKVVTNVCMARLPQLVVAHFLGSGKYEKHLRFQRLELEKSMMRLRAMVARCFPEGTKMTLPKGGYVLWLELPSRVDSTELAKRALEHNISIAAGPMFSSSGKYKNYIRLSFALRWNLRLERSLITLGELVDKC